MTRLLMIASILVLVLIPVLPAGAQNAPTYEYVVKIVCGKPVTPVVAEGQYFTAINIHNPNDQTVSYRWKIAVAIPGEKPGPVTQYFSGRLGPDEAIEIDCRDIFQRVFLDVPFVKGFVVLESAAELDVVAVYTASGRDEYVTTMDVEQVTPRRRVAAQPDLVIRAIDRLDIVAGSLNLRVAFTVANIGSAGAGNTISRIQSDNGVPLDVSTPALAAGATVTLSGIVSQPSNCFDPDCTVSVTADAANMEAESNEANNTTIMTFPG